jgi:CheY-like chemotaxis protein
MCRGDSASAGDWRPRREAVVNDAIRFQPWRALRHCPTARRQMEPGKGGAFRQRQGRRRGMKARATVLVVDDEATIRDLVQLVLEDEGYRVRAAASGAEALAAVARERPDLGLSDISMPQMDGLTLADRLARLGIPVILMSAVATAADLPGVPLIRKPFDLDRLLGLAAALLRRARRPTRIASAALG